MDKDVTLIAVRAKIFEAECTMHGMIAENKMREIRGESPSYGEDSFQMVIKELKRSIAILDLMI